MDLVRIGLLGRAHGVRGEIALEGASLTAAELLRVGRFTWRARGPEAARSLTLETARDVHGRVLVRFAGFADRDQAAGLTRGELLAERAELPDPGPGVAYTFELIGLQVVDETGRVLGVVADIVATAAHPIWVIRGERELLIPAVPHVVRGIDRERGVISVTLPAGLEDL